MNDARFVVLSFVVLACWGCDASTSTPDELQATSVVPEGVEDTSGASQSAELEVTREPAKESPLLPGSGLVPSFDKPSPSRLPTWRWVYSARSDSRDGLSQREVVIDAGLPGETRCTFDKKANTIGCRPESLDDASPDDLRPWRHELGDEMFIPEGQLVSANGMLFMSHHSLISAGAQLIAYDVKSGEQKWRVDLKAVPDVEHSRYKNETVVAFDASTSSVLVFGKESAGGYVERRDARTGKLLAHRVIDSWSVNHDKSAPLIEDSSRTYKNRPSKHYPDGQERLILSSSGEEIALHIWQK